MVAAIESAAVRARTRRDMIGTTSRARDVRAKLSHASWSRAVTRVAFAANESSLSHGKEPFWGIRVSSPQAMPLLGIRKAPGGAPGMASPYARFGVGVSVNAIAVIFLAYALWGDA